LTVARKADTERWALRQISIPIPGKGAWFLSQLRCCTASVSGDDVIRFRRIAAVTKRTWSGTGRAAMGRHVITFT